MLLLGFIFFSLRINYNLEEARCSADKSRRTEEEEGEDGICIFIENI
jgi:hypothetical protein